MSLHKPPCLRPGDRVSVVAPSGPFDPTVLEAGLALLRARYQVMSAPDLGAQHRYLAGDDDRRARELQDALSRTDTRAVFAARGGYGMMRLLPRLDFSKLAPKPVVGFSDITALHIALQARGHVSFHSPVLTQLGKQPEASQARFFSLLESTTPAAPLQGNATFIKGTATGTLWGGNLSLVASLVGTPFFPQLSGSLLFLEEVGERPYRLDRMWTQLRLSGALQGVKGIVLGDFTDCEEKGAAYSSLDVLRSLVEEVGLPCAAGFTVGHGTLHLGMPLGVEARLDADAQTLTFLEGAVTP